MTDRDTQPGQAYLSIGEAANRLGVSPSTLRAWERKGLIALAVWTPGGQRRYRAADVDALLAERSA
jgi:excisionase family DNA binding protein